MNVLKGLLVFLFMASFYAALAVAENASVVGDDKNPRIAFGAADLREVIRTCGVADVRIFVGAGGGQATQPAMIEADGTVA